MVNVVVFGEVDFGEIGCEMVVNLFINLVWGEF